MNAMHPGEVDTHQQDQAVGTYDTLGNIGVAVLERPSMKDHIDDGCQWILGATTNSGISH